MSQNTKRDAGMAFDGSDSTKPHRSRKRSKPTAAASKQINSSAESSRPLKTKDSKRLLTTSPLQSTIEKPLTPSNRAEPKDETNDAKTVVRHGGKETGKLRREKHKHNREDTKNISTISKHDWNLSFGVGGAFINQDPLISLSGDHLILPTKSSVQIFSTSTSLLVRSIYLDVDDVIKNVVLAPSDGDRIFVFIATGVIYLYDWRSGRLVSSWNAQARIHKAVALAAFEGTDWIYVVFRNAIDHSEVKLIGMHASQKAVKMSNILLQSERALFFGGVAGKGMVLAMYVDDKLLLGQAASAILRPENAGYSWHEVQNSAAITCVDIRMTTSSNQKLHNVPNVNIALGLSSGLIVTHEGILQKLKGNDAGVNASTVDRQLHWHRDAVQTVKWSRDGNYLISGGLETVLVIWQLDLNQRQYLPHLSSPILNLTVSANGAAYALRQADNSVMILSTADLLPSTSVSSLNAVQSYGGNLPAVLHPSQPQQLLCAFPAQTLGQVRSIDRSAVFLQTFDIDSNLQIGRQALTRNFTTTVNSVTTTFPAREPTVSDIQISHDGKWMATVDSWMPAKPDLDAMDIEADDTTYLETTLRFWGWSPAENAWELVTKVDDPHDSIDVRTLSLIAYPGINRFATIASDKTIRVWSLKARVRNGVPVKDKSGEQLYTWSCHRKIDCGNREYTGSHVHATSAALAVSQDESVLAASWTYASSTTQPVYLINPETGSEHLSRTDLTRPGITKLAFLRHNLVVLSSKLRIFDVVTAQLVADLSLQSQQKTPVDSLHLVVNTHDNSIACAQNSDLAKQNNLHVFSLDKIRQGPVFHKKISDKIGALLTNPSGPGFVLVDGASRVQHLKPGSVTLRPLEHGTVESEQVRKGLDSIFGPGDRMTQSMSIKDVHAPVNTDFDTAMLIGSETNRTETLEQVVTATSTLNAPSVKELFDKVSRYLVNTVTAAG